MGNWTKTPNAVYAAMCEMSEPELRITLALTRETYGRQRATCKLTYNELCTMTGLVSHSSIKEGLTAVRKRGFFEPGDGRSEWHIKEDATGDVALFTTGSVETTPDVAIETTPSVVPNTTPSVELPSKGKKEKKKKGYTPPTPKPAVDGFGFKPSPVKSKHPPSAADERVRAILDVCGLSADVPKHFRAAENAAAQLAAYSPEFIRARYTRTDSPNGVFYWYRDDWRGQKGQQPTPDNVVETISKERVAVPAKNGVEQKAAPAVAHFEAGPDGRY